MNNFAPIALFVYNRLEHTKKTIESLQKNFLAKESDLYIFSDGWKDEETKKKVSDIRNYLKTISGFKKIEIIERENNTGLANNIISGVTEIINKFGKIIVLEDDLVTSSYFLEYMNEALEIYKDEEEVISIHGYIYPIKVPLSETFFIRGADCWGWATWKRGWGLFEADGTKLLSVLEQKNLTRDFDFNNNFHYVEMLKRQINGKNDSWAIRWYASAFLGNKLTLYPGKSLIDNIGQDSSGTNRSDSNVFKVRLTDRKIDLKKIRTIELPENRRIFEDYFKSLKPSIIKRIINRILK
jgi:hypothetical protein